jgi:hypothetical protein
MDAVEILRQHENKIKNEFNVSKIGIFGSFARGENKEESDIDVLVEFKAGFKTFDNFMDLKFYLEDIFDRTIDLVTVSALKPQLKEDILQDVIYA